MSIYELFNLFFLDLCLCCAVNSSLFFSCLSFSPSHSLCLFFRFHTFFPFPSSALPYVRLHSLQLLTCSRFIRVSVSPFFCINLVKSKFGTTRILWLFYCSPNLKYTRARTVSSSYRVHFIIIFFFVVMNSCTLSFTQRDWYKETEGSAAFFFLSLFNVLLLKRQNLDFLWFYIVI